MGNLINNPIAQMGFDRVKNSYIFIITAQDYKSKNIQDYYQKYLPHKFVHFLM